MRWFLLMIIFVAGCFYLVKQNKEELLLRKDPLNAIVRNPAVAAPAPAKETQDRLPQRDETRIQTLAMSNDARQTLYNLTNDPTDKVRWTAVELLYRTGDPGIRQVLRHRLEFEPESWVKTSIIAMLAQNKDRENLQLLGLALADTNEEVRLAAVNAIATFNSIEAVPTLSRALHDESNDVKIKAIEAIKNINAIIAAKKLALQQQQKQALQNSFQN